jgi:glycosyltransferase involved in cell wall biosynthesis
MACVSIVVPTRNRARHLVQTLRSLCAQQQVDSEIVVVDDGSTDDTARIAAAADARVRVIRNPSPVGVSAARNTGVAACRGDWIAFCDDDDLWAPDKLAAQLSAAREASAGWVYAGDVSIDSRSRVFAGVPPPAPDEVGRRLQRENALPSGGSNIVVRADLLATTGGFRAELRRTEDWDLWLRLLSTGLPAWVRRPLVAYRFHASNIAADIGSMVTEARRLGRRHGIPVDVAAMHRRAAWTALRAGRRGAAVGHYARAVARGDLRSAGRAAFALFHPAVGTDSLFNLVRGDRAWMAEAERWLAPYVDAGVTALEMDGSAR